MKSCVLKTLVPQALPLILLSPPALSYEVVSISGGGAITGKVVYQGSVPIKKIIPTKDKEVCGGPRDEAQVLLGPDKGVQDAVVYLKDVAKGKAWGKPDKSPVLDQEHCKFEPPVQVIRAGNIDIVSSDPVLHNTHGFYGRRTAFNLALPNKGTRIPVELTRSGMVRVECDAHGWMLAHIYVADSPYYVLTGKDGSFSIKDIPPGQYTLVTSQYFLGDTETAVTVKSGETVKRSVELKKK
ncbi:MAG TPA: hypothetical protein VEL09_01675 [Burkholderiales bacterium]|nr:hypothetical protein [Burkholderiales bacterium]